MIYLNLFPENYNFRAMAIFPFLVKKKGDSLSPKIINHEKIHFKQQFEMLIIFFYLWYLIEYLIRLVKYKDKKKAYRSISFEQEAYSNENNLNYIKNRRLFSWIKYLKYN